MTELQPNDADIDALLGAAIAKVGESPKVLAAEALLQAQLAAAQPPPRELVDPRTQRVRFTRLKALANSAAHYLLAVQDNFEETLATRIGSGVHAGLFLNRPVVTFPGRRQGKAWERFERRELERGAVIVNEAEYATTSGMINAVRRHRRASEILFDTTTTELRIDWARGERACRSTPDSFRSDGGWLSDLKTTRCAEPRWLAREALRRHYHAQLSFYGEPTALKTGSTPGEEYIVAVENVAPYCVTVLRLPDETREVGSKLCHVWFSALLAAEHSNYYGGYVEGDVDLELPGTETHEPISVEIDGQLMTID